MMREKGLVMKDTTKPRRPELLAPAGTVESFRAAIDAGANAVYLGLTDFNARLRARNFTMKTLSYAVPFAHARGVRVYVTLNTLVKQAELGRAVDFLYQLEQIGVDAVIAQDMGIARISAAELPRLRLHASTQTAVHNSAGVEACRLLGFRRVVLARELTLAEIGTICAAARGIECEVFVHGALCYSLSGECLASSFFGGSSGNRGRCTQVCRRAFDKIPGAADAPPEYFFSPNDLTAIDSLPRLCAAGIASLKIEGRMKGPHYVRTVVGAFRRVLDDPEKSEEAKTILSCDMGRRKTRLFLDGFMQESIIDPKNPAGTGMFLGRVESVEGREISVPSAEPVSTGDILRLQPQNGNEGVMAGVTRASLANGVARCVLDKETACVPGDSVFLVGLGRESTSGETKFDVKPAGFRENLRGSFAVARRYSTPPPVQANRDRRLFVKIDSYGWLPLVAAWGAGGIICAFDREDMLRLAEDEAAKKRLGRAAYIEPPPFIPEEELQEWRRLVRRLCAEGDAGLMCQNLGHVTLAAGIKRVRADFRLWCLNRAAQAAYRGLGMKQFAYSLEDDSMNIRDCASQNGMAYLFTHVPLFVSRMKPAVPPGTHITDRLSRKTLTAHRHGLYYLVAEETVSLFHKRRRLEEMGIITFCVDLSFMEPDGKVLDEILDCYTNEKKFPGSCLFNFKGGLK
jgi:U32 family peptidase